MSKTSLKLKVAAALKNVPQKQLKGSKLKEAIDSIIDESFGIVTQGTATLVAGTVTVETTKAITGAKIQLTRNTPGGTPGHLSAPSASIVNGVSFTINSSSNTDTSTVNWSIAD